MSALASELTPLSAEQLLQKPVLRARAFSPNLNWVLKAQAQCRWLITARRLRRKLIPSGRAHLQALFS